MPIAPDDGGISACKAKAVGWHEPSSSVILEIVLLAPSVTPDAKSGESLSGEFWKRSRRARKGGRRRGKVTVFSLVWEQKQKNLTCVFLHMIFKILNTKTLRSETKGQGVDNSSRSKSGKEACACVARQAAL